MEASIDVNAREFSRWAQRVAIKTRRELREVLGQQVRLAVKELANITPPMSTLTGKESWSKQKTLQQQAIRFDMLYGSRRNGGLPSQGGGGGVIHLAPVNVIRTYRQRFGDVMQKGLPKGWEGSRVFAKYSELYDESGDRIAEYHRKARQSNGRVSAALSHPAIIGRSKAIDKVWTTKRSFERYLRTQNRAKVGRLKAGVNRAAAYYGVKGIPKWIAQHGTGEGGVADGRNRSRDPFVQFSNLVSYASKHNRGDRLTSIVVGNRARAMQRMVQAKMQGAWRK